MVTQYTFAGDYTGKPNCIGDTACESRFTRLQVEAIDKAVNEVAKFDAGE